jgi:hypothetical protein
MALEEKTFISSFDCLPTGAISVRKTTQVLKDGAIISETYWRTILGINDPQASAVLDEPYYATIAASAWSMTPPSPIPVPPSQGA